MPRKTYAFTLIELLVVISIIALLIGILLPALGAARNTARDLKCLANQRQMGIGFHAYASEYDQILPPAFDNQNYNGQATDWSVLITAYLEGNANFTFNDLEQRNELFSCPQAAVPEGRLHYGTNRNVMPVAFSAAGFGNAPLNKLYNIDWESRASDVMWLADAGQYTLDNGPDLGDSFSAIDFLNQGNGGYRYYSASDTDNMDAIDEGPNTDGPSQAAAANLRWRHGTGGKESGSQDNGTVNFLYGDGHASSNIWGTVLNENVRPGAGGS